MGMKLKHVYNFFKPANNVALTMLITPPASNRKGQRANVRSRDIPDQQAATQFGSGSMAAGTPSEATNPVLRIRLSADYAGKPNVLRDVTFDIDEGEIFGLMGESGSGKSTLGLSILRLLDRKGGTNRGEAIFCGRHLERLTDREMRRIRGKEIALVPQSAIASLNPALRIGTQFAEAWKAHRGALGGEFERNVFDILDHVRLPADEKFLRRYPRQLSVGQAQRVLIALGVLHRPRLLIADEPTSALDAITRADVLTLLNKFNRDMNMAVLFISHELPIMASFCRRVAVLEQGRIVECGVVEQIFSRPEHPYTRALLRALPTALANSIQEIGATKRTRTFVGKSRIPNSSFRAPG
jgi:ABC-type dipeptide/oligopeptide/nickel transport system ATPase component